MRDLVTLFVEASLAKGEWLAALHTLRLSSASTTEAAPTPLDSPQDHHSSYHLIARTLAKEGNWAAALSTLRCAPSPSATFFTAAYLSGRVQLYHAVVRSYYYSTAQTQIKGDAAATPTSTTAASPAASLDVSKEAAVLHNVVAMATEAFGVLPSMPKEGTGTAAATAVSAVAADTPSPSKDACVPSATELIDWCRAQACAASLSDVQTDTMLRALREAAQAAQRSVVDERAEASNVSPARPAAPQVKAQREDHTRQKPLPSTAPPSSVFSPAEAAGAEKLHTVLHRRVPAREDAGTALALLPRTPARAVTPRLFTSLTRSLAQRGCGVEFDNLVRTYVCPADPTLFSQGIDTASAAGTARTTPTSSTPTQATAAVLAADAVVLKSIAEACRRLRCTDLAADLLRSRVLRSHLTPSAAVPLVMVLRDAAAYTPVLEWWASLRAGEETVCYPLLQHAKLSSYVASCVLRRARDDAHARAGASDTDEKGGSSASTVGWVDALRVFEAAKRGRHADPALTLLFELRLLRQVRQWEAAMQLFSTFAAQHPVHTALSRKTWRGGRGAGKHTPSMDNPTPIESVFAVLTEERVEQWVPEKPLQQLRQHVARYRCSTK